MFFGCLLVSSRCNFISVDSNIEKTLHYIVIVIILLNIVLNMWKYCPVTTNYNTVRYRIQTPTTVYNSCIVCCLSLSTIKYLIDCLAGRRQKFSRQFKSKSMYRRQRKHIRSSNKSVEIVLLWYFWINLLFMNSKYQHWLLSPHP